MNNRKTRRRATRTAEAEQPPRPPCPRIGRTPAHSPAHHDRWTAGTAPSLCRSPSSYSAGSTRVLAAKYNDAFRITPLAAPVRRALNASIRTPKKRPPTNRTARQYPLRPNQAGNREGHPLLRLAMPRGRPDLTLSVRYGIAFDNIRLHFLVRPPGWLNFASSVSPPQGRETAVPTNRENKEYKLNKRTMR